MMLDFLYIHFADRIMQATSVEVEFLIVYYNCETMTETGAKMFRFFLSCYVEELLMAEILYWLRKIKGGVAKSFTAVNQGYELWRREYRVLLMDNDKQGNMSKGYGRYDGEQIAPITRLLNGEWSSAEELIQPTDYDGIDIIAANMSLFGVVWNLIKESPADMLGRYRKLWRRLNSNDVV